MDQETNGLFSQLFREVYGKHFKRQLDGSLSEAESKLLAVEIEDKTGLVIGFKTVKNFSRYVTAGQVVKEENPSLATLDTLARYVLNAPVTTETDRKREEGHYPYWYLYKREHQNEVSKIPRIAFLVVFVAIVSLVLLISLHVSKSVETGFIDDFSDSSFIDQSWLVINRDEPSWERRGEYPGVLQLFTMEGDNWPDTFSLPLNIKNMVLRPINSSCFDFEAHLQGFVPWERWQQAGLILLEDTTFLGKGLRLSIAYNNFFGGFDQPAEIIVQGITSLSRGNPEEILHHRIFQIDSLSWEISKGNLKFSALKIEKRNDEFRFLLANGASKNVAYKEIGQHSFRMDPKYIGFFALKGNVKESGVIPAKFDLFKVEVVECE